MSDQTQPPDIIVTVRGPGRAFDAEWRAIVNVLRVMGATVEEVNEEPCEPRRISSHHRIRVIAEHLPWGG